MPLPPGYLLDDLTDGGRISLSGSGVTRIEAPPAYGRRATLRQYMSEIGIRELSALAKHRFFRLARSA